MVERDSCRAPGGEFDLELYVAECEGADEELVLADELELEAAEGVGVVGKLADEEVVLADELELEAAEGVGVVGELADELDEKALGAVVGQSHLKRPQQTLGDELVLWVKSETEVYLEVMNMNTARNFLR